MPEWWTYGLSDIVMFTRETYYRLFGSYNRAIWPAQVFTLAAGVGIGLLLQRRPAARSGRLVSAILAVLWAWVAVAFHARRYETINWAAAYFAAAFALEAALLLGLGAVRGGLVFDAAGPRRAALAVLFFALAFYPIAGVLFGRDWRQVELFGVAPDPTAVGTLGILLLAGGRTRWELLAIPLVWCVSSGLMQKAANAPDAWLAFASGAVALGLAVATSGRVSAGRSSSRSTSFL